MSTMPTVARHPESIPGPARATYQDVLDAPAHRVAEIVEGALHTHPRPAMPHALASSVLGRRIGNPYHDKIGGPGGWWIIDEPELHLGEDILVPDLAGWRRERMPDFPETAYVTLAPDWCARCCPSRPADSTSMASARSMLGKAFRTCGSSIRGSRPGSTRAARRPVGVDRKRQGRRSDLHPSLRRGHVQPRRSLVLSRRRPPRTRPQCKLPTVLVALTLGDAERPCTRLNARLGLDRDTRWAIVARSMHGASDGRRH